jgi:hypothetical protein
VVAGASGFIQRGEGLVDEEDVHGWRVEN